MAEDNIIDLRARIHQQDSKSDSDDSMPERPTCVTLNTEDYQGENGTRRLLDDVLSNMRSGASCVKFTPKNQPKDQK